MSNEYLPVVWDLLWTLKISAFKNLELLANILINVEEQNKLLHGCCYTSTIKKILCFIIKKQVIFLTPPLDIYFEKELTLQLFICQNDAKNEFL